MSLKMIDQKTLRLVLSIIFYLLLKYWYILKCISCHGLEGRLIVFIRTVYLKIENFNICVENI